MVAIGEKLDSKYVVTRRLGGGGFGEVFLANDALSQRPVAIKVLARAQDGDHTSLIREMQALAQFNHPHVVAFYHHFADPSRLYLVLEYCAAGSLDDRLRAVGACPVTQAFAWGLDLCETLGFVHAREIVHHDIKPANILFAEGGTIKLGDFGVANSIAGTIMYLPPEMLLGERVDRTDPRVDIYALGLTLLETITGRHPFAHLLPNEMKQARVAHDFVPETLPRWVQEILLKATEPTPELRFQTADDFATAIRSRHVAHIIDSKRIKADALARRAEAALVRRRWKAADKLARSALQLNPDCVAALLAAGRCQILIRRIDQAREYFSRAVSINPRTPVQKELGWMSLVQGRLPLAISQLTDHLQRNGSDYEAYNLLLECFYLTDRFEAGESLADTLITVKAPSECFRNNRLLCRILRNCCTHDELSKPSPQEAANPFVVYNLAVATEKPAAWGSEGTASLKSKLLFQEHRFGMVTRTGRQNQLVVHLPDGSRRETVRRIVTIGSMKTNDIVLQERSVSRRHCVIVNCPRDVWLYDLGSTCGTFVDGQRVNGHTFLDGVHKVTLGRSQIGVAARSDLLI